MSEQQSIRCLICNQMEPRRTLLLHISEHIEQKPHGCEQCDFQTAFENDAMAHEFLFVGHSVKMNVRPYISRLYRSVYADCDYADRNGGSIEGVLQRPLLNAPSSANNYGDVAQRQQQVDIGESIEQTTTIIVSSSTNQSSFDSPNSASQAVLENQSVETVPVHESQSTMETVMTIDSAAIAEANDMVVELPDSNEALNNQSVSIMSNNLDSVNGGRSDVSEETLLVEHRQTIVCRGCQMDVNDTLCSKLYHITAKHLTDLAFNRCKVCRRTFTKYSSRSDAHKHALTHRVEFFEARGDLHKLIEDNFPECAAICHRELPRFFDVNS